MIASCRCPANVSRGFAAASVLAPRGSLWRRDGSIWRLTLAFLDLAAARELVEMIFQKLLHVRFLVVDLVPEHLVAQHARTAVAL